MISRSTITNASWNTLATICAIVISFFTAPVLIRALGVAQYGVFLLVASISGMLSLVNLGLGEATLRYVAHYHGDKDYSGVNRVFGSTLSFYVVVSILVSALMFAAAPVIVGVMQVPADEHRAMSQVIRLVAIAFLVRMITNVYASIPLALQRYDISSKISISTNVARTTGYLGLAIAGYGLFSLVLWDLTIGVVGGIIRIAMARKLLPGLSLWPSFSLAGLREIYGYSVFSFLTYLLNVSWRESGKLIVGAHIGVTGAGYLGPAENIAVRIWSVVVAGTETLLPKFSANRDEKVGRSLLLKATWASVGVSTSILVPLAVVMPILLGLWISPDFTRESAVAGQLVALSLVAPAAFAPTAAFLRGIGKPGLVTGAMGAAGTTFVISSLFLVPMYGINGVGYAHLWSSVLWVVAAFCCWGRVFGRESLTSLLRVLGVPMLVGAIGFFAESAIFRSWPEMSWMSLACCGVLFVGMTGFFVSLADWVLGGEASSKLLLVRLRNTKQGDLLFKYLAPKPVGE